MKVERIVTYYSNNVPRKLTSEEFYKMLNSLPIYPQPKSPLGEIFKSNWGLLLVLWFPLFWIIFLVNGTFESIANQYTAVNDQNKIIRKYYDAIYTSRTYEEYIQKYNRI